MICPECPACVVSMKQDRMKQKRKKKTRSAFVKLSGNVLQWWGSHSKEKWAYFTHSASASLFCQQILLCCDTQLLTVMLATHSIVSFCLHFFAQTAVWYDGAFMTDVRGWRKCLHDQRSTTVEKWVCLCSKDVERLHIWYMSCKKRKKQPIFPHLDSFKILMGEYWLFFFCAFMLSDNMSDCSDLHGYTLTPTDPLWWLTFTQASEGNECVRPLGSPFSLYFVREP